MDAEVIPNLMIGFGIDQIQAEYVANIRLRNINKEYILKRTQEVDKLQEEIDDLAGFDCQARPHQAGHHRRAEGCASKRYAQPRLTEIVYDEEDVPDLRTGFGGRPRLPCPPVPVPGRDI